MRFTQDSTSGINVIRSYAGGELRVNETAYRGAIILSAATLIDMANIHNLDDLLAVDTARILALEPELVLLGTGARQVFPAPAFGAQFMRAGIGFEVMDTSAACRTFNVLVGEQRRVAAILLIGGSEKK
jgi:uncharacterized protein